MPVHFTNVGTNSSTSTAYTTAQWFSTTSAASTSHVSILPDTQMNVLPNSTLRLPDGSKINVDGLGNFTIMDKDAIVTYKGSNMREFNKHINASDLLEAFIKDLGNLGVKQNEVLNVPIELFINWLIFKAAEQDGDNAPNDVPLLESSVTPHKHPKCLWCGKFIKKILTEHKIFFCNPEHHNFFIKRLGI